MSIAWKKLRDDPVLIRIIPFVVFLALTGCQGKFGESSRYWIYALKTIVGGWMLSVTWPYIQEMRWKITWEGVCAGVMVFILWVGLDDCYPSLEVIFDRYFCPVLRRMGLESWCQPDAKKDLAWNPFTQFQAFWAWCIVMVRIIGSSLVVPPLEEVFYRSFIHRYLISPEFEKVSLGIFKAGPFFITSLVFGLAHHEWLAGILCGMAYQGLVCWKARLGDAMTAHATTNLLLGVWVVQRGAWHFW